MIVYRNEIGGAATAWGGLETEQGAYLRACWRVLLSDEQSVTDQEEFTQRFGTHGWALLEPWLRRWREEEAA